MIRRKRDVWLTILGVTCVACVIVASAVLVLYPPSLWAFELTLSMTLTTVITVPATYLIASANLKTYRMSVELKRLVERDRLTDVGTRDFFFESLAAKPDAYGVSVVIDIDHFKSINDTYGHLAGDAVLREVAQVLKGCCRENDLICRFGGEEFVVFLEDADRELGHIAAERMRKAVADSQIVVDETPIGVTVSVGASLVDRAAEVTQSIKEADAALYRAKRAGRNRVKAAWSISRTAA